MYLKKQGDNIMNNNMLSMLMQMMGGSNPQQMVQNIITRNPQMNAILQQQKNSGLNMEQYVRQIAKQRNIDIEPMIKMMRQRNIKF